MFTEEKSKDGRYNAKYGCNDRNNPYFADEQTTLFSSGIVCGNCGTTDWLIICRYKAVLCGGGRIYTD